MRYAIDLHSHSTCSDGVLSPTALVERAAARGVTQLALTDHDTTAGIEEARNAGQGCGVQIIEGVEISAWHGQEVHMLGYFVRPETPSVHAVLERQSTGRLDRVREIGARLDRLGMSIDIDAVIESAAGNVGRPHVARALIAAGHVPDFEAAFARLLKKGAAAYIPASRLTATHAIRVIHEAGGAAVIAHPGVENVGDLEALVECGLDGVEAHHPAHHPGLVSKYATFARKHGLVATGGSDFHAPGGRVDLGDRGVPTEALEALRARTRGC